MRIGIRERERERELVNKIYARESLGGKQESEADETMDRQNWSGGMEGEGAEGREGKGDGG